MDLMYLPDAFTFHVIRSPVYNRGYDYLDVVLEEEEDARRRKARKTAAATKEAATSGKANKNTTCELKSNSPVGRKSSSKDSCPMCKERRRRSLASYIRSKSRQDSDVIEEEEETTPEGSQCDKEKDNCTESGETACSKQQ